MSTSGPCPWGSRSRSSLSSKAASRSLKPYSPKGRPVEHKNEARQAGATGASALRNPTPAGWLGDQVPIRRRVWRPYGLLGARGPLAAPALAPRGAENGPEQPHTGAGSPAEGDR